MMYLKQTSEITKVMGVFSYNKMKNSHKLDILLQKHHNTVTLKHKCNNFMCKNPAERCYTIRYQYEV